MFKKPFTVKSNTNVRTSDKRKLLARFSVGPEISSKAIFSVAKVVSANGVLMNIYICDKEPLLFEFHKETNLFPTVYFAWLCPGCVPILFIHPNVVDFLENGADLMLPGVTFPPNYVMPEFRKDSPIIIAAYHHDTETFSPVAVGSSAMSSTEMIACGMKGKGVNILHIYQDFLWESGSKKKIEYIELSKLLKQEQDMIETEVEIPEISDLCIESISLESNKIESTKKDHPRVSECYSITGAVANFFKPYGYKKGDIIQSNQIREVLIDYSTSNKLLDNETKKVELDDTLQSMIRHFLPDKVQLNDIVQKIGAQMTKAFVVTLPDGRKNIKRDHIPLIELKVEQRAGKKVVTLINNVTFYGIDVTDFRKKIQTAFATGATINKEVHCCEGPQILVQGNNIYHIGELLQNEYGIQKKYIKGLELGIKPKKK